ncbi:MAG: 3-oxoadipate--succinyl-CoA transferase subunit B [Chloroflexi bacterium]|nr:3-oxoadipate--succinyl-CoA transferase subunit B [Chloroflexota bacterium]
MRAQTEAPEFTTSELMVVVGARELKDGQLVFAGLGIPQIAVALAQRTHAPRLIVLNEIGLVDPHQIELGVGNADPRHWYRAAVFSSFLDIVGMVGHRGLVDVGFLGALEIDEFGNNNSSEVQRDDGGIRRFGGGGGANDIASHAKSTIMIIRHEARKLVERLVHNTSPGFLTGGDARRRAGLPGRGPSRVITDKALFTFDTTVGRIKLLSIHPGITHEDVRVSTGFPLEIPPGVPETGPPTQEEVRLIREELDPTRMYTSAI